MTIGAVQMDMLPSSLSSEALVVDQVVQLVFLAGAYYMTLEHTAGWAW